MNTISSCLIVKNAAGNIINLLDKLSYFSNEIVITDTGSTDGTQELVESRIQEFYDKGVVLKLTHFDWINDFAAARNNNFSHATQDWVFWCDHDDDFTNDLIGNLMRFRDGYEDSNADVIFIDYLFGPKTWIPRRRLINRSINPTWTEPVHEYVWRSDGQPMTEITWDRSKGYITHEHRDGAHTDRNLRIYLSSICSGGELSLRGLQYYANELFDSGFYGKCYELYMKWLLHWSDFEQWNALNKCFYIVMNHIPDKVSEYFSYLVGYCNTYQVRGDVWCRLGQLYQYHSDTPELCIDCYLNAMRFDASGLEATLLDRDLLSKVPLTNLYCYYKDRGDEVEAGKWLKILDQSNG